MNVIRFPTLRRSISERHVAAGALLATLTLVGCGRPDPIDLEGDTRVFYESITRMLGSHLDPEAFDVQYTVTDVSVRARHAVDYRIDAIINVNAATPLTACETGGEEPYFADSAEALADLLFCPPLREAADDAGRIEAGTSVALPETWVFHKILRQDGTTQSWEIKWQGPVDRSRIKRRETGTIISTEITVESIELPEQPDH